MFQNWVRRFNLFVDVPSLCLRVTKAPAAAKTLTLQISLLGGRQVSQCALSRSHTTPDCHLSVSRIGQLPASMKVSRSLALQQTSKTSQTRLGQGWGVLPASLSHYHLSLSALANNNNNRDTSGGHLERMIVHGWSLINCVSQSPAEQTKSFYGP